VEITRKTRQFSLVSVAAKPYSYAPWPVTIVCCSDVSSSIFDEACLTVD